MKNVPSILVTGAPRSGTTWVGRILAADTPVTYVHEPFNITVPRCSCGIKFEQWFTFISDDNAEDFTKHIAHTVASRPNRYTTVNTVRNFIRTRRLRPLIGHLRAFTAQRVCIKDPIALFSAEWLASTFNLTPVILIRHPAAVVNSFKQINWGHPFKHFLDQPLLIQKHLKPFMSEIEEFSEGGHDIIEEAALLWKLIYHVVNEYRKQHPDWLYVYHEVLAQNPEQGFQQLASHLKLRYTPYISQAVKENLDLAPSPEPIDPYTIKRDSASTIGAWKQMLSPHEIERIQLIVEDVSRIYYSETHW